MNAPAAPEAFSSSSPLPPSRLACELACALLADYVEGVKRDGYVIDETSGLFVGELPSRTQRYNLMLAPGYYVSHENTFSNGTTVLTIKRDT